jgi:hypothetical protein
MSTTEDAPVEAPARHPLDVSIREKLALSAYHAHVDLWDKANDRLLDDPDGAITSARSLLETTCKHILTELKVPFSGGTDLPKLYNEASKALGMAPGGQLDPSFRAIFSAAHQIVRAVAEIRNRYGDSHGRLNASPRPLQADAELAVHLAGAVSCFLVSRYESHLSATRRLTRDGKAVLWFDKTTVWRLVDHATNSPRSRPYYGEEVGRCLLLCGDPCVYLISNGDPPIYHDGTLINEVGEYKKQLLIAEAEGCGALAELDALLRIHNAIDYGDDFSQPIPVEDVREALKASRRAIVIVADPENYELLSDVEFERRPVAL